MKRGILISSILVAALAVSSGAVFVFFHARTMEKEPAGSPPSQYIGVDKTVDVTPVDIAGKKVTEIGGMACFATLYSGPELLLMESDAAVYARVDSVEYFVLAGDSSSGCAPWNKMDVTVLDAFKGDVQAGDKISIVQFGGYLPLKDQIRYFHDEDRFADMTAEEIDATVFKKTMEGAPLPQVGEQGVYFLVTDSTPDLPQGAYEVMCSYQGKYIRNADGILERFAPTEGYYLTDAQRKSRSVPENALPNGERPYTVEQMAAALRG